MFSAFREEGNFGFFSSLHSSGGDTKIAPLSGGNIECKTIVGISLHIAYQEGRFSIVE